MKTFTVTILCVVVVVLTVTLSANDKAREQKLQQAIDLLESKGDLAAATPLLEDVAKSSDRALAARGLLHLAQAQERYGKGDALATYQRIVNEFGGPADTEATTSVVAAARTKLAALGQRDAGVVVRHLWERKGTFPPWATNAERVSRDGRYVVFTDWKTGDLAARDLASGKDHLLTRDAHWPANNYAQVALPSPDSNLVAYSWHWVGAKQPTELRVIGRDGGQARVVYRNDAGADNVFPAGWLPDSKLMLAAVVKSNTVKLLVIPIAGGAPRLVKSFDSPGRHSQSFLLSPDGRFAAYTSRPTPRSQVWDVSLLSLDSGSEMLLTDHPADDRLLGWFPDGNRILFESDRGGNYGIWSTRVVDGRAQGDAMLIRPNTGHVEGVGFTKQGHFYYRASGVQSDVHLATIDPTTGRQVGRLTQLEGRFVGGKADAVWSPNGERIAYVQETAPGVVRAGRSADLNEQLAIQTVSNGQVRLWPFALEGIATPVWLPDGRSLMVRGTDLNGVWSWYSVNVETGALTTKELVGGSPLGGAPALSTDGRRWSAVTVDSGRRGIATQDLSSDDVLLLFSDATATVTGGLQSLALSSDGRWFAVTRRAGTQLPPLFVIPSTGGEPRSLLASGADDRPLDGQTIAWSHNGRHVFVVKKPAQAGGFISEIWQVPVDGGQPRDPGIHWAGRVTRISAHPDGRRIAVSTVQTTAQTWVLQNIPPQREK